jgi:hypothetical protein
MTDQTEQRIFTSVVLRPEVFDSHDHIYSADVVMNACYDFNEHCLNSSVLEHFIEMNKSDVAVVESFISYSDYEIDGKEVKKGDWVMSVRVHNDQVWELCKSGTFKAFSVGCQGTFIDIEDEDGNE